MLGLGLGYWILGTLCECTCACVCMYAYMQVCIYAYVCMCVCVCDYNLTRIGGKTHTRLAKRGKANWHFKHDSTLM